MPEQFHFIQPAWLLALVPLAVLLWRIHAHAGGNSPWRKIVDPRLLPLLMGEEHPGGKHVLLWPLAIGWLLAVLALANPSWEQLPQPLMQSGSARVVVLDLSRSMLAADLQPSRLVRARFKVEDILAHDDAGQTGLVVFAGDAFSVTPLTRDADTIRAQLKALDPDIMPSQGSRADLGLLKAEELLQQAGMENGQVILVADGVEGDMAARAAARLRQAGYRVSVLGVGTAAGAPLPDGKGGVTKDGSGKPLLVKLDSEALQAVAQAGGGRYSRLTGNEADIAYLLEPAKGAADSREVRDIQTQQWKEQGPLLAVLLLPLAALAFRRGWLLSVLLCMAMLSQPGPAMAFSWDDLWLRTDQQAARALRQQQYEQAARLAEDPLLRGSAEYKQGDYQEALEAFSKSPGADAAYNRGNALARLGSYEQAIAAYDEALQAQPGMEDAAANKAAVEALLKEQEQQQQQNQQEQSDQQSEQDQQSNADDSSPGKGDSKKQQQGGQQDSDESSGGGNGEPTANEQASSANPATGGNDGEQTEDGTDNAFADANRQLDADKAERDDDKPSSPATPADTDKEPLKHEQAMGRDDEPHADSGHTAAEALSSEEQLAAQQWLRRITDDPGGLLRRKFLYQYGQRGGQTQNGNRQDW